MIFDKNTISPLSGGISPDQLNSISPQTNNKMSAQLNSIVGGQVTGGITQMLVGEDDSSKIAQSQISNSGVTEGENDFDNYFDQGEVEEYINVQDSEHSCHILPVSNTKYNSGDSIYEDDEVVSVVEEEEDDENTQNGGRDEAANGNKHSQKHEFKDSDPEVQNARLLQKYAEMQNAMEQQPVPSNQNMHQM